MSYVQVEEYVSSATRMVYGEIVDESGNGIGGANVVFCDTSTITDSSGNFEILEPPYMSCFFDVTKTGYDDLIEHELTSPLDGQALYVKVVMTIETPPPPPPGQGVLFSKTSSYGETFAVIGHGCNPAGICTFQVSHMTGTSSLSYDKTVTPVLYATFDGELLGQIGFTAWSYTATKVGLFEVVAEAELPVPQRTVSVTVKNTGAVEHEFSLEVIIVDNITGTNGCNTSGSPVIYEAGSVNFTLKPGWSQPTGFIIPGQYARGHAIAKVYDNGACLDGDHSPMG